MKQILVLTGATAVILGAKAVPALATVEDAHTRVDAFCTTEPA